MKDLLISKLAWIFKKSFKVTRGQKVKFAKLILQQSYGCCWKGLDLLMKSMELVKQNTLIFYPTRPLKINEKIENIDNIYVFNFFIYL